MVDGDEDEEGEEDEEYEPTTALGSPIHPDNDDEDEDEEDEDDDDDDLELLDEVRLEAPGPHLYVMELYSTAPANMRHRKASLFDYVYPHN